MKLTVCSRGEAEKLHHVAGADKCQGPKSAEKSILDVSQLAWWEAVMVRRSFLTGRRRETDGGVATAASVALATCGFHRVVRIALF